MGEHLSKANSLRDQVSTIWARIPRRRGKENEMAIRGVVGLHQQLQCTTNAWHFHSQPYGITYTYDMKGTWFVVNIS
jgi:phosphopantetheinyl transferase